MKVCILMGSPRGCGNTAELCKPFVEELGAHRAEYRMITLEDKDISPCRGCYHCQSVAGAYGCAIEDDMQGIVEEILRADVLVFATPIYTWQAPARLKAVMDRMYGLNKYYGAVPRARLNKGQRYALIATCGYEPDYGAGLLSESLRRWCEHSGLGYLGMYAVRDEDDLASFRTKAAIDGARAFARMIVGERESSRPIEPMDDFFTARADGYDEHMLKNVVGCAEGYARMAALLPQHTRTLLDLGCGTGLELDPIFGRFPDVHVTGIDLTQAMLERLRGKYPCKRLTLIHGSYFDVDFGAARFDAAISFQTLHHFTHEAKLGLYRRLWASLKEGGLYLECDYMVREQEEEDALFAESRALRERLGVPDGVFYHFDTPCTAANQISLLQRAGFSAVRQVWSMGNTTLLAAEK